MKGRFFYAALCLLLAVSPTTTDTVIEQEVLDKTAPGGDVVGSAPTKSHPIYGAHDHSIAAEALDKDSPGSSFADQSRVQSYPILATSDQLIMADVLHIEATSGSAADHTLSKSHPIVVVPFQSREQAGSSDIDHDAHIRKTDLVYHGTDSTSLHESSASRALLNTVATKRSLHDETSPFTTCNLIAAYDTNETAISICELKEILQKLYPLPDVSATTVAVCRDTEIKKCPPPGRKTNRHLMSGLASPAKHPQVIADFHGPFNSTTRFLQSIATPPPTSTPAPGYIVFTAIANVTNCSEVAAYLSSKIERTIYVDVEGTIELGQVSDSTLLCHFYLIPTTTQHL
jgi:hypothetical protein